MLKYLKWLDNHILEYLSFGLLIIVPLYPKLPIADIIPGYIVRLRVEDFLIALTFLIWLIQIARRKISLFGNPLLFPIIAYLVIGFISSLSAIYITKTVPIVNIHLEKLFLHYGRRIEYFSVFFIFFSSLTSLRQIKKYVYVSAVVLLGVAIYGFGQKYLYWPAYSTMNREFSKGITLYLTEHARVLSTFGGHYDLAAYLMMVLTIFIPLAAIVKNLASKALFLIVSLCGFWLLILTVSRASFVAYLVSITLAFCLLAAKKGWIWSMSRLFIVLILSLGIMLSFGDLSSRFGHILKLDKLKSIVMKPAIQAPSGPQAAFLENVANKSDMPPSTEKPGTSPSITVPSDVTNNAPISGTGTGSATLAAKPRTYSNAAIQYDLSTGIRLDYTWPQAIKGFMRNPALGSGYSTLTKKNIEDFTEAESTDNDYLRSLGETGLLGFLSFFGIVLFSFWYAVKNFTKIKDPFFSTLVITIGASIIGLLVNAVYIDVFEASKVAYMFWILIAIMFTTVKYSINKKS